MFVEAKPTHTERSLCFLDGHDENGNHVGWQEWQDIPQYKPTPFGTSLRAFRREHDVTVREVAARMRMSLTEVSQIERGSLLVSPGWARSFGEAFGLDAAEWEAKAQP